MLRLLYTYVPYIIKISEKPDIFHVKPEYLFLKVLDLLLLCGLINAFNSSSISKALHVQIL